VAAHQDKGRVVRAVMKRYEAQWAEPVKSIALGDSPNDFAMLDAADIAVLVARHDGSHSDYDRADCRRMAGIGPAGWAEAMGQLRDEGLIDA
jgi:mannosyl-3-phosphoglycerate phosphatase